MLNKTESFTLLEKQTSISGTKRCHPIGKRSLTKYWWNSENEMQILLMQFVLVHITQYR